MWMIFLFSGLAFLSYFFLFIKDHPHAGFMKEYWSSHFMPLNPLRIPGWIGRHLVANYSTLAGLNDNSGITGRIIIGGMFLFLSVIGLVRLIKEKKYPALALLIPVVIHLLISAFRLYPFNGRLLLYLSPAFLVLSAYGLSCLVNLTKRSVEISLVMGLSMFLTIILWFPVRVEEIKEVIRHVNDRTEGKSRVYFFGAAIPAGRYYSDSLYQFRKRNKPEKSIEVMFTRDAGEVSRLMTGNEPVWVIFSHDPEDEKEVMALLPVVEEFRTQGAAAYRIR
jgi:hypothetical protein